MKNILFLGCGNMWLIILENMLQVWIDPANIFIKTKSLESAIQLKNKYGVNPFENQDISFDILVLAFKPWNLDEYDFSSLKLKNNCEIISVLWWISVNKISEKTWINKIVRLVVNTPMREWKWVCWIYFSNLIDRSFYLSLLISTWQLIEIKDESLFPIFNSIAWCWPALYYFFCKIFEDIALRNWLSEEDAKKIARQTFIWSANHMEKTNLNQDELISEVATKWWTTEKIIKSFLDDWLDNIIEKWINVALWK